MKYILVTNNRKVYNFYKETDEVIYLKEGRFMDVLDLVRDKIHKGHTLLTDPIMSNIADSKNPYKSIAISSSAHIMDEKSMKFIEGAHSVAEKLEENGGGEKLSEEKLKEYRYVDLNLIREWVKGV
ncbi:hypothetical protein PM10SUCC1_05270 [Propionigenium maris DSM 9537]|uniref:GrdX protein n=1 Tax=Propionigenium maris DSM 9537 TaxID=1123000 RepID=A0A9W6GJ21_9FUSO|nr:GrdX family protein [Propionigenium maris]GLI55012.1 hypothetical protein PM10SUCC1_05270 [Propionigenium maris DSM 9537]